MANPARNSQTQELKERNKELLEQLAEAKEQIRLLSQSPLRAGDVLPISGFQARLEVRDKRTAKRMLTKLGIPCETGLVSVDLLNEKLRNEGADS